MPPKGQAQRRTTQSQNEQVYDLGVVGRKTGLTLEERQRDAHGFEAVDNLFSSPEKDVNNVTVNGVNGGNQDDSDQEQTMEIDDESQMGPATTMKQRQSRPSLPRARSPIKTHLQSPARQNPHVAMTSSPSRGSIIPAREPNPPKSVNRRLDFSKNALNRGKPPVNGSSKVNAARLQTKKPANARARANDSDDEEAILRGRPAQPLEEEDEEEEQVEEEEEEHEESMQVIDAGGDIDEGIDEQDDPPIEPELEVEDEEPVEEPKPEPQPKKRRGRKPKGHVAEEEEGEPSTLETAPAQAEVEDEPVKKKQRGRPAKTAQSPEGPEAAKSRKRRSGRLSGGSADEERKQAPENNANERKTKRPRTEEKESKAAPSKTSATKEKGKPGRKRKSSGVGVEEPVVQRGPPLPKGRGLVTVRREEETNMRTTRSGRLSYKPLDFWKGDRVLLKTSDEDIFEDKGRRFVMPAVAGVVRAVEPEAAVAPRKRRGRPGKRGRPGRRSHAEDDIEEEEERDEWEYEPGHIAGECRAWRPEHETGDADDEEEPEIVEEEIAVSEAAIQFKDVKDASFRFAKTLTLPFFGSGVVDFPPGSEKRTKNSRRMQMVFFVHAGTVDVTVAQTEFRIGTGGMFFVPRGNHYSIANNTDRGARLFFSQGCEMYVQEEWANGEETQLGA